VVLDFGSFSSRVGYAGEDMPKVTATLYYKLKSELNIV
jgi:actin-related protein